jgi:hypothetical protein
VTGTANLPTTAQQNTAQAALTSAWAAALG